MQWHNKINTFTQSRKAQGSMEAVFFVYSLVCILSGLWSFWDMRSKNELQHREKGWYRKTVNRATAAFITVSSSVLIIRSYLDPLKSPCKYIREATAQSVWLSVSLTPSSAAVWSAPTTVLECLCSSLNNANGGTCNVLGFTKNRVLISTLDSSWSWEPADHKACTLSLKIHMLLFKIIHTLSTKGKTTFFPNKNNNNNYCY